MKLLLQLGKFRLAVVIDRRVILALLMYFSQ
ncbi:hypothetical protein J2T37_001071 [Neisseria perflava]|nr:hypothetical protein [Neisseria perflava]MCP1772735.1 hypothetical protein [Neisseria perflava]